MAAGLETGRETGRSQAPKTTERKARKDRKDRAPQPEGSQPAEAVIVNRPRSVVALLSKRRSVPRQRAPLTKQSYGSSAYKAELRKADGRSLDRITGWAG